ncbi:MAG: NERD domain-containing protein [Capsulimonas sp.]|uniref:NERD domain-containing protein n=1 Tax=Capsulimonas sp. TaxID=2494211 RepID=UPI0032641C52
MARAYPNRLPDRVRQARERAAEIKLYDALITQLDDNWAVFYSVPWIDNSQNSIPHDGECDFIIAHHKFGILVVEVKGGSIGFDGSAGQWTSTDRQGNVHDIDPFGQLRSAKYALLGMLKSSDRVGNQWIDIGHAVCFPDIVIDEHSLLPPDAPREIIVDRTDLEHLEDRIRRLMKYWIGNHPPDRRMTSLIAELEHRIAPKMEFEETPEKPTASAKLNKARSRAAPKPAPQPETPKYQATITRSSPTALLFLIDQSKSMGNTWQQQMTKAEAVADAVNRTISELVQKCSKADGVRHYFDVGVVGYGGTTCSDLLSYMSSRSSLLKPISDFEDEFIKIEERQMKIPNGVGGIIERTVPFPVWIDARASGKTPMCAALEYIAAEAAAWAGLHSQCFPPSIIHITDGAASDGDPEQIANVIRRISTADGECLLFNIHLASNAEGKVELPVSEAQAPATDLGRRLFRMSSMLPSTFLSRAADLGYRAGAGSRGYMYNADFTSLVHFLSIGTEAARRVR